MHLVVARRNAPIRLPWRIMRGRKTLSVRLTVMRQCVGTCDVGLRLIEKLETFTKK
jgi:hypothetical protein